MAEFYPRRRDPVLGIWAHRQALAARAAGAEVRVLALERPLPPVDTLRALRRGRPRPLGRSLRALAGQPRRDRLDGVEVEYVRFLAPPRERSYASWHRYARPPLRRALERLHRDWPVDLVHAHYALPAGAAARGFCAERGLPLVVSVHGGDLYLTDPSVPPRVAAVLNSAALVLCNSRDTLAKAAALTGSAERMRVVHLGAEAPAPPPHRHDEPTLATLGHLIERKRHADVARALRLVAERAGEGELAKLRWTVIGEGPERAALEKLCAQLGIAERVSFTGQLPPPQALEQLARCHVMALPSVDEAFGVAYAEALACGVPAIGCMGEGGPEEIATLGEGIVLVPPGDVEALAASLELLLADGTRWRELSTAAVATAREHFSWERCGEATVAAYRDALAGNPA